MRAKHTRVIETWLTIFGFAVLISSPIGAQTASPNGINKVSVGHFIIDVPREWNGFSTGEVEVLRRQYLEQSKQIYQHFTGSDDPSKSVHMAAYHIPGGEGSFVLVSFSVPPQSNLIALLKNQVGDKMKYGIQEGYIQKYLGIVSVDDTPLAGFYTKAIGKDGNFEVSGGLEHKDLRNIIIQLTLLCPSGWGEKDASTKLEEILRSVTLKTN